MCTRHPQKHGRLLQKRSAISAQAKAAGIRTDRARAEARVTPTAEAQGIDAHVQGMVV